MKKSVYLFFIVYFVIIVIGSVLFYLKYMRNFSSIDAPPLQIETVSLRPYLYYADGKNLAHFDPLTDDPSTVQEGSGDIGQLDLKEQNLYFEMKRASSWEIWQGDLNKLNTKKIAGEGIAGLETFTSFILPRWSPDKTKLAFVGEGTNEDAIIIYNPKDESYTLERNTIPTKISTFAWKEGSNDIIFCSQNLTPDACFTLDLTTGNSTKLFEARVQKISWELLTRIVYLSREDTPHLYSRDATGLNPTQIDDVSAHKKIVDFEIGPSGQILYQITAEGKNDLYLSNNDGSNRLQLTTDGNATSGVFSSTDKIGFLRQKDGIYAMNLDKTDEHKIMTLTDSISAILAWK